MSNPLLEIPPEKFYKWGFYLFMFVAIMNTVSLIQNIMLQRFLYMSAMLSAFGSLAFNYLIAGFFFYLWRGTQPSIPDDDFEKLFLEGGTNDIAKTKTKSRGSKS